MGRNVFDNGANRLYPGANCQTYGVKWQWGELQLPMGKNGNGANCRWSELSMGRNVDGAKWQTVDGAKWQWDELPLEQNSKLPMGRNGNGANWRWSEMAKCRWGEMAMGRSADGAKCQTAEMAMRRTADGAKWQTADGEKWQTADGAKWQWGELPMGRNDSGRTGNGANRRWAGGEVAGTPTGNPRRRKTNLPTPVMFSSVLGGGGGVGEGGGGVGEGGGRTTLRVPLH